MEPSKGIFFIAVGEQFVNQAIIAAKTIKKHSPQLSIALYTNIEPQTIISNLFDKIITVKEKKGNQNLKTYDKVLGFRHSPFDYTLALDTDIYVMEDLSNLFVLLDKFDMVFCHEHTRENILNIFKKQNERMEINVPDSFPIFQGGLLMYKKNEKVNDFLSSFIENYEKNNFFYDMYSLRETVWNSDIRFLVLPEEYNFNNPQFIMRWAEEYHIVARPKIFHYTQNKKDDIPKLVEDLLSKVKLLDISRSFSLEDRFKILKFFSPVLRPLKNTGFYKKNIQYIKKIIKPFFVSE